MRRGGSAGEWGFYCRVRQPELRALRRLFLLGEAGVDVDAPFDAVVTDDV